MVCSTSVLGTSGCLIDLGLWQIKIVLNPELVVNVDIAEMKYSLLFSEEKYVARPSLGVSRMPSPLVSFSELI